MERRLWKFFDRSNNLQLEGRLFYAVILLSSVALISLALATLNWPERQVFWALLSLGASFLLIFQLRRKAAWLIYAQSLYLLCSLGIAFWVFTFSGGLQGPVFYGVLLSFLVLLTTSRERNFQRVVFALYLIYGLVMIHGPGRADYSQDELVVFTAIFLFIIVIFYLGTVYLKGEYDRIMRDYAKQKNELEQSNQAYRQQVFEISELNAQKSRLFSIIGHDLRSPLSGIEGLLHLFSLDENQSEDQKIMQQDLLRLTRNSRTLLDNLLFWSKRETNAYEPSLIDYPQVIKMVADYLDPIAKSKQVELKVLIEPNEGKVWNDAQMLEMIIRNLVQNAIKFVPKGGWVKLRAYETDKILLLEVEDNGIGMSAVQQEKLFGDEREVRKGTAEEKGIGLGLKLCSDFVKTMQGEISVRSTEGKGSCFTVQLPRTKQDSF